MKSFLFLILLATASQANAKTYNYASIDKVLKEEARAFKWSKGALLFSGRCYPKNNKAIATAIYLRANDGNAVQYWAAYPIDDYPADYFDDMANAILNVHFSDSHIFRTHSTPRIVKPVEGSNELIRESIKAANSAGFAENSYSELGRVSADNKEFFLRLTVDGVVKHYCHYYKRITY